MSLSNFVKLYDLMNILPVYGGGFNFSRRRIELFQYIKMYHASLHPDKAGSCKQPLSHGCINREISTKSCERTDQARNIQYYHDVILAVPSAISNCSAHSGRLDNHVLPADIICRYLLIYYNICLAPIEIDVPMIGACGILFCDWASVVNKPYATQAI